MENTDGQRTLTSLPEASDDDSSQNEQQGANHGDDRERQSKTTKKPGEPGDEPDPLRYIQSYSYTLPDISRKTPLRVIIVELPRGAIRHIVWNS